MILPCKSLTLPRAHPSTAIPMNTLLGPTIRRPIPASLTTPATFMNMIMHTSIIMNTHMILERMRATHALAAR